MMNGPQSQSRLRILVMDDDQAIRRIFQIMLERLGCACETAPDGQAAIRQYGEALQRGAPFHAVILDLTVKQGLDGIETLAQLRTLDPGVRAILTTGQTAGDMANAAPPPGFLAVLAKPFKTADLEYALHVALAGACSGDDSARSSST